MEASAAHFDAGGPQRPTRSDEHAAAGRIFVEHIQRLSGGDPDAAALTDGEAVLTSVPGRALRPA